MSRTVAPAPRFAPTSWDAPPLTDSAPLTTWEPTSSQTLDLPSTWGGPSGEWHSQMASLAPTTPQHLVMVDMGLTAAGQRRQAWQAKAKNGHLRVIDIDPDEDGLQRLTQQLKHEASVASLHLICRGTSQGFWLGHVFVDQATLVSRFADFSNWTASFIRGADIILYGCDLQGSLPGRALMVDLSLLTGTEVVSTPDLGMADMLLSD